MTSKALNEILNEKSTTLTLKEIMELLDEELEKPTGEIDTGIIDSCLNALESAGVI